MSLGSTKHHLHFGCALSSPQRDSAINGSTCGGVELIISAGYFRCNIAIKGTDNLISLAFKDDLCGSKDSTQARK